MAAQHCISSPATPAPTRATCSKNQRALKPNRFQRFHSTCPNSRLQSRGRRNLWDCGLRRRATGPDIHMFSLPRTVDLEHVANAGPTH
eukprot:11254695-Alexandrium_andersonii.AAC.1